VITEICSWLPPGLMDRKFAADTISTNLTKVSSTGHSGSSGILLMLMYVVVAEKLPGQKRCDEEEAEEHEFLGVFDVFLK